MHRLLPLFFILIALLGVAFFVPFKRNLVYFIQNQTSQKINLTHDGLSCPALGNLSSTGEFDSSASLAFYNNNLVDYPKTSLEAQADLPKDSSVLGYTNSNGEEKWIEIDLTTQTLRAWEGNRKVMEFPISSGLWYPTVTGTYNIYWKLRYTRMTGGNKDWGTFYDLPNVPDTMYFYKGYGIHGAYWHNNFGHPMSHGCVNEPLDKAHQLFEWAGPYISPQQNSVQATPENQGSRVLIH